MIHAASQQIASYCVKQAWVEEKNMAWCVYAIEKKLLTLLFFLGVTVCAAVCGKYIEAASFTLALYFLRRRLGGWHAGHVWSCQLLSILLVLAALASGPRLLAAAAPFQLLAGNIIIMAWAFVLRPVYPPQLHFDAKAQAANRNKKNLILLFVALIQAAAWLCGRLEIVVFSSFGVLAGVISVYIEKSAQRAKERNVAK